MSEMTQTERQKMLTLTNYYSQQTQTQNYLI